MTNQSTRRLVPDAEVARRYGVHPSTLVNWDKNEALGFPPPVQINNRKYRYSDKLDAFDEARASERQPAA